MESRIFSQVRGNAKEAATFSGDYVPVEPPIDEFLLRQFETIDPRWLDENHWIAEEALGEIRQSGIDVLAWYTSFRSNQVWGIFIRRSAIKGLTYQFATKTGELPQHCLRAAYEVLYGHELFHFQVDCAYLKLDELAAAHSLSGDNPYLQSRKMNKPWDDLEEGLANARSLYKTRHPFKAELTRILKTSPHGYRDFGKYRSKKDFFAAVDQLISQPDASLRSSPGLHGIRALVDLEDSILNGQHVPVYLVNS
jgi:hypothetical protein